MNGLSLDGPRIDVPEESDGSSTKNTAQSERLAPMSDIPDLGQDLSGNDNQARTIVFEDIELSLRIGAFEAEKHAPQRVRVSAEVLIRPAEPWHGDRLDEVVPYHPIHDAILALASRPHVELQETLAEEVARICLEPRDAVAARVYVRKLDVYDDCKSVGIRIVRTKPQRA